MREDGDETGESELVERFSKLQGYAMVGDLDEQIAFAVDAVALGKFFREIDVFVREVKIAATAKFQRDALLCEPLP